MNIRFAWKSHLKWEGLLEPSLLGFHSAHLLSSKDLCVCFFPLGAREACLTPAPFQITAQQPDIQ